MGGGGRAAPYTPAGGGHQQQLSHTQIGNSSTREAVMEAIRKTSIADNGTTKEEVFAFISRIAQGISMAEVDKCVKSMTDEGLVYSTIDENHFMCTE